ncbi:acyl-coenzyme A synthetase/AMP-(fatty) acid ligase [Actinoalloteichus hoggarensis]|uniref:AMP-binding protein n=1 Tax=Actinoalloteichus hoggarensis TaxID=1470176 RepID=UPI0012FD2FAF|nr:AMP-binding protein [Actinoalloteichus hoggarensis]MBB5924470.1 acyl-coenzyme A synthetase/AMP-(fatty) acid ligase [Actinoalloteichus hoggarensis]
MVTADGRTSWRELIRRAEQLAARLPASPHGWVLPADRGEQTVLGLLILGMAEPAPSWVLGDARWADPDAPWFEDLLRPAAEHAGPPSPATAEPVYATATSGSSGTPRLLFGHPHGLPRAVETYTSGLPEYAAAEVFATCSPLDFAAAFYMALIPALLLGRDLVLFGSGDWRLPARELAGRSGICVAPPALEVLGARSAQAGADYRGVSFVPAGGGLTIRRAERITAGFSGAGFLTMLGSTETGLLTVTRTVRDDGYVGVPLPGKPVWLDAVGADGVGMMWTRGPDTRFAARGGPLLVGPDGAVSTGDLAHRDRAHGGFVLDGRSDDLVKVDGISVYPGRVAAAVRAVDGAVDAAVTVERDGPVDRIVVVVIGTVDEEAVRAACAALPQPVVPHRVSIRPAVEGSYTARGKVRL